MNVWRDSSSVGPSSQIMTRTVKIIWVRRQPRSRLDQEFSHWLSPDVCDHKYDSSRGIEVCLNQYIWSFKTAHVFRDISRSRNTKKVNWPQKWDESLKWGKTLFHPRFFRHSYWMDGQYTCKGFVGVRYPLLDWMSIRRSTLHELHTIVTLTYSLRHNTKNVIKLVCIHSLTSKIIY